MRFGIFVFFDFIILCGYHVRRHLLDSASSLTRYNQHQVQYADSSISLQHFFSGPLFYIQRDGYLGTKCDMNMCFQYADSVRKVQL